MFDVGVSMSQGGGAIEFWQFNDLPQPDRVIRQALYIADQIRRGRYVAAITGHLRHEGQPVMASVSRWIGFVQDVDGLSPISRLVDEALNIDGPWPPRTVLRCTPPQERAADLFVQAARLAEQSRTV